VKRNRVTSVITSTSNKSKSKLNDKNPLWKGNKVGLSAIHAYIRRRKPRPSPQHCELCHKEKTLLDLSNIHPAGRYTRTLSMYLYLCRLCHMTSDGRINRFYNSGAQRELAKTMHTKARARATSMTVLIKETCD
jgi:hypothetical protein